MKRYKATRPLDVVVRVSGGGTEKPDPLKWWKENQGLYPILARLARVYLALQATSAPSERVFSVASRLIGNKRTRLSPSIAGKMLFVSENWDWYESEIDMNAAVVGAGEQEPISVDVHEEED